MVQHSVTLDYRLVQVAADISLELHLKLRDLRVDQPGDGKEVFM